jgi:uncharacterized protein YbjT (DUF2867 family)
MKVIAVVGATGSQGGSVAKYLLKDGKYAVRALTRDPNSEKSKKLSDQYQGISLVKADLEDKNSLVAAFKDADGVFGVTDFWQNPKDVDLEIRQGHNIVDAAIDAGVKHVVLSTLHDVEAISKGTINVPHFTNKAKVAQYAQSRSGKGTIFSYLYPAAYLQSMLNYIKPSQQDGALEMTLPVKRERKVPFVDITSIGAVAVKIFDDPEKYDGKHVHAASSELTFEELVKLVGTRFGKPARYNEVDYDTFRKYVMC